MGNDNVQGQQETREIRIEKRLQRGEGRRYGKSKKRTYERNLNGTRKHEYETLTCSYAAAAAAVI